MFSHPLLPLIGGLLIALCGAGLLAVGSELQSRSVVETGGRVSRYLRSPKWLAGAGLLGVGVATNLLALALAPVSVVQSMGIAALVCSVAYGAVAGRIVVTRHVIVAAVLATCGVIGMVVLITTSPGDPDAAGASRIPSIVAVMLAVGCALVAALLVVRIRDRRTPRWFDAVVLVLGAAGFGCATTVLKVVVSGVQERGVQASVADPLIWAVLALWLGVGVVANLAVQRSYGRFPTATVVAGLTVVDPTVAAIVGVGVLGEARLGIGGSAVFLGVIGLAAVGVVGLTRIPRREQTAPEPRDDPSPARPLRRTRTAGATV